MGIFDVFKRNEDFSNVTEDNIEGFLASGKLVTIYLVSPRFGGSEGMDNQIVVTKKAAIEKDKIDDELAGFLMDGKSVQKFNVDLEYKGKSIVPTKIKVSAVVTGDAYSRVVEIW
ncbi:MAG: hypothetical protein IJ324_07040 [Lachnospiraceae bacterium]|nr:hypothetical protein [Lachnospiraceae bacterium]